MKAKKPMKDSDGQMFVVVVVIGVRISLGRKPNNLFVE